MSNGEKDGPARSATGATNLGQNITISGHVFHGSVTFGRDAVGNTQLPNIGIDTLPRESAIFVDRVAELSYLEGLLRASRSRGSLVVITGMAGCGKTALALRLARKVADAYPDGVLFANLSNYGDATPTADEVLDGILRRLGLPGEAIPRDTRERVALYRSLLHRRKVLMLLDGVVDERQVRQLILSDSSSATIVTSRKRLTSLEDAAFVGLDVLPPDEAVLLLERVVGGDRSAEDRAALGRIARLCGYLPLAIRIAGARLRDQLNYSVAEYADELSRGATVLDKFDDGEWPLWRSLDISYRELGEAEARAFRLLALVPGRTFEIGAAATVLGVSNSDAQTLLGSLVSSSLVTVIPTRRYQYHDLVREYARSALSKGNERENSEAVSKLRQWYLVRVREAVNTLRSVGPEGSEASVRVQASQWLEDERANLLALGADVLAGEQQSYISRLADALYPFYQLHGYWADCQAIHELALGAARNENNDVATVRILNNLGVAYREQHRLSEAVACFEESVALSRRTGLQETHAVALMNLGVVHRELGDPAQAVACLEAALGVSRELGDKHTVGQIFNNLGAAYQDMSRLVDAHEAYRRSLELCRSDGDRQGEASALINLGLLYEEQGELAGASSCFSQSLVIAREMFDRVGEARALRVLGAASAARQLNDDAVVQLEASVRVAAETGDSPTVYAAGRDLANLHMKLGSRGEALNWYRRCEVAAQELGDVRREADVVTALATLAEAADDLPGAHAHWRRAVQAFRECGDSAGLAAALCGSASVLMALNRPVEALSSFEEAAAIARDRGDKLGESAALEGLAGVLSSLGQNADAAAVNRRIAQIRSQALD